MGTMGGGCFSSTSIPYSWTIKKPELNLWGPLEPTTRYSLPTGSEHTLPSIPFLFFVRVFISFPFFRNQRYTLKLLNSCRAFGKKTLTIFLVFAIFSSPYFGHDSAPQKDENFSFGFLPFSRISLPSFCSFVCSIFLLLITVNWPPKLIINHRWTNHRYKVLPTISFCLIML